MFKVFCVGIERLNRVMNWLKLPWEVLFLEAAVLVGFSLRFTTYCELLKQFQPEFPKASELRGQLFVTMYLRPRNQSCLELRLLLPEAVP